MRHTPLKCCTYRLTDRLGIKQKVLNWLRPFSTFCLLDSQQYSKAPHFNDCIVAAGVQHEIHGTSIGEADALFQKVPWLFGHLAYELNHSLHGLISQKEDPIGFAPFYFFVPKIVLELKADRLIIHAEKPAEVFTQISATPPALPPTFAGAALNVQPALSKEEYLQKVQALQQHIRRGDCYEVNFCQAFFAPAAQYDPFAVYQKLTAISPNPFSAFYRQQEKFLICASPERFLAKKENRFISQPIKGTMPRNLADAAEDAQLKERLRQSPKEQSENVMVVDLVRNDLAQICQPGSVRVEELFGIYSFPQVHQMISTISGEAKADVLFSQLLEATFPMGSMTGAPKRQVMHLIDTYEPTARGLFSGAVGYKSPTGDFDFNVVIRSILYNQARQLLSYQVGSGITFYSDAEQEWEECLLKASAIKKVLTENLPAPSA